MIGATMRRWRRWKGPRTARQRLVVGIVAIALMVAMVAPLFGDFIDRRAPEAAGGVFDFSGYQQLVRPVELTGKWRMTWLAGQPQAALGKSALIAVPGQWTGAMIDRQRLPANGRARYELILHELPAGRYTLHIPVLWAANRVLLNGEPVSGRGVIGDTPATTRYNLRAQTVPFSTTGEDVRLAVEMAAFHHRDNGMEDPPVLALSSAMDTWYALKWSRELVYHVSLLLIAALGIAVFLFRPQDRASLYFGLSCLFFVPVTAIVGFDNLLQLMVPGLDFRTSLAIQYGAGILAIVFFFAHPHELYPRESSKWIARAIMVGFALVAAIEAAQFLRGDTVAASLTQQYFMMLALVVLVYILAIIVRAAIRGRDGSVILLLGMGLFITTFIMGAVVQSGWVTRDQIPGYEYTATGIVMLLYSHVILMAERWSLSVGKAEQINDDLRQLLEVNTAITSDLQLGSLLERIVGVTSKILRADRSSLFLKDRKNPVLASLVAQGVVGGPIRFDIGRGLAGYAYATGETVNISDAYADDRFNRTVDEETGYRTRSVLTVPIAARDGRRIGVMQALNREDGDVFTPEDAARLSAFGAQAAVAIDNARLFGEAISARNFDDSILRSMADGVIALDGAWKITKLNAAAAEILGASATLLAGLDLRALLAQHNPWLTDEIEAVVASGEPKLLLDVAIRTARDRPSSANLSISQLLGEDGPVGVLLVIEDISEEKRLQGTMRRFMTQAVVDQVLANNDEELLFGSACEASVLFADIRGFTTMAEELSARETVETLNELFSEMFEAVAGHDGVLDKYIGDAVMAVYGAPLSSGRDPQNALASALEMLGRIDPVNARRAERGASPIRIGIGIASGEVVAGTIGSPKRMDYTVIGDSVNLAARLQDLTKTYGVEMLVCAKTAAAIEFGRATREIDLIAVRGRKRPETIVEVLARDPVDPAARAALLAAYAAGRRALVLRDWDGALAAFGKAVDIDRDDRPSRLMLARARALAGAPPSDLWDGVWRDNQIQED